MPQKQINEYEHRYRKTDESEPTTADVIIGKLVDDDKVDHYMQQ